MKTLEELGISPAPWHAGNYDDIEETNEVYCPSELRKGGKKTVCSTNSNLKNAVADARLIAAAPELYECLREAVDEYMEVCEFHHFYECDDCGVGCPAKEWRAVLAKAAGEEGKDGNH